MSLPTSADPADLFFEHLAVLRTYAERVFVSEGSLTMKQETDKMERMREFFEVGAQCEFSQKQLVTLVYADLLDLELS